MGAAILTWVRSDTVTLNGATVSTWTDKTGLGKSFSQGTPSKQPTYELTSGPSGHPALALDGTDDELVADLNFVNPTLQNIYVWMILKQDRWTFANAFIGDVTNNAFAIIQGPSAPFIAQFNGSAASFINTLPNSWCRLEAFFSGTTADFMRAGSNQPATGFSAGTNASSGGIRIGKTDGAGNCKFRIAELFYANRRPTSNEVNELNSYCVARYGPGLV